MSTTAKKRNWIDILLWLVLIVLVVVSCLRLFVVAQIQVDGLSMYPTLDDGDTLCGSKLATVSRGDIVVFDYDDSVLIKRAVALTGDKIYVNCDSSGNYTLYIYTADGETLTESYSYGGTDVVLSDTDDMGFLEQYDSLDNSYTVPDNSMLALGDNRAISHDSRHIGAVSLDDVIAVIIE